MAGAGQEAITVDAERLTAWVGDQLPGSGRLRLERIGESTGAANALFTCRRCHEDIHAGRATRPYPK